MRSSYCAARHTVMRACCGESGGSAEMSCRVTKFSFGGIDWGRDRTATAPNKKKDHCDRKQR